MTAFVMAEENRSIKLNSGFEMPVLGLGTWTLTGETCENAVYEALKSGYRLIDTARYYGNESEVGKAVARAIKEGICKREEIFVTTKLVPWTSTPEDDIDDSLQKLGLSHIDLCLLHQHGSASGDDAVYRAMCKAVKAGKKMITLCTSGGSGLGRSGSDLSKFAKGVDFKGGKDFTRGSGADVKKYIEGLLK